MLQEAFLFTDTVMNNLLYASEDATEEDAIEAAKKANAHDFIMGLPEGYDTMLTERGANLSQGQRQMITIARAMVADPKMMILDEATSNVDTRTEKLIQDGMRKLMEGKTSFSIAHRLATIRDSSRIMVLNGGEIVEMDSHDDLMAARGLLLRPVHEPVQGQGPRRRTRGDRGRLRQHLTDRRAVRQGESGCPTLAPHVAESLADSWPHQGCRDPLPPLRLGAPLPPLGQHGGRMPPLRTALRARGGVLAGLSDDQHRGDGGVVPLCVRVGDGDHLARRSLDCPSRDRSCPHPPVPDPVPSGFSYHLGCARTPRPQVERDRAAVAAAAGVDGLDYPRPIQERMSPASMVETDA